MVGSRAGRRECDALLEMLRQSPSATTAAANAGSRKRKGDHSDSSGSSSGGSNGGGGPLLLCLPYARLAYGSSGSNKQGLLPRLAVRLSAERAAYPPAPGHDATAVMHVRELVSMQFFNGDTSFSGEPGCSGGGGGGSSSYMQWVATKCMRELARVMQGRRLAAELLVGMRGKQVQLPSSDLELACDPAPVQQIQSWIWIWILDCTTASARRWLVGAPAACDTAVAGLIKIQFYGRLIRHW